MSTATADGQTGALATTAAEATKIVAPAPERRAPPYRNVIESGTELTGHMKFPGGVRLKGLVTGTLEVPTSDNELVRDIIIDEAGVVEGPVIGYRVIVLGRVFGPVVAREHLYMGPKAVVTKGVLYAAWRLEEGSQIEGPVQRISHETDIPSALKSLEARCTVSTPEPVSVRTAGAATAGY